MATKAQIRTKVANRLGIKAIGQTLSNAYTQDLDDAYDEVYAELREEGNVSWLSTGEVPDEIVNHFVSLVSINRVIEYDVPETKVIKIASAAAVAKDAINELIQEDYFNGAEDAEYF